MYNNIEQLQYHVFTDNNDEWAKTMNEVKEIVNKWKKDGFTNFRVWSCEWNDTEGIYDDVDCLYSVGTFPM